MRIEAVTFKNFPPFADATVEFPQRASDSQLGEVHLLTGQNGSGKTRLLCLLAAACGNRAELDARIEQSGTWNGFVIGRQGPLSVLWSNRSDTAMWTGRKIDDQFIQAFLAQGIIPEHKANTASLVDSLSGPGLPVIPLTTALAYRGTANVADAKISAMQPVPFGSNPEHLLFEPSKKEDQVIAQSMANIKMAAAMEKMSEDSGMSANGSTDLPRAMRMMQRLEGAISRITGRKFYFHVVPKPEVSLKVYWGDSAPMRLRQLPDGLRSIIGWLVSCVAKLDARFPEHPDPLSLPLILLLDEPEGHLHPAWQRKLLPAAQHLFPHAQIFAATHSPFVISSVNEGWIHIFRADDASVVTVDKALPCKKGDSYLDVVEDILGVKEWYDPESEELLAKFRQTRDSVLSGNGQPEVLAEQAQAIASRSDSLRDLMAREMHQFERQRTQAAARS
jgi:energy-coupling factor transporter ATP-binding protein EcfA2